MNQISELWQSAEPKLKKRLLVGFLLLAMLGGVWYSNSQTKQPEESFSPPSVSLQTQFKVHVTGAVAEPGLYSIDAGARVQDAISLAGGMTPGALESSVNLARLISDGEQIVVLHESQLGESSDYVSLNRADARTLEGLPGIGPATAKKIIEFRNRIGSFSSVEQLQDVPGIGRKLLDQIRDQITL